MLKHNLHACMPFSTGRYKVRLPSAAQDRLSRSWPPGGSVRQTVACPVKMAAWAGGIERDFAMVVEVRIGRAKERRALTRYATPGYCIEAALARQLRSHILPAECVRIFGSQRT